jgi:hypothetical protein
MNSRKSLVDEMAEWQASKRERTRPCPNKKTKRLYKWAWRWLLLRGTGRDFAMWGRVHSEINSSVYESPLTSGICYKLEDWLFYIDGYDDVSNPDWWHPPKDWDWVWASPATEDAPAVRRRKPLDPRRLP